MTDIYLKSDTVNGVQIINKDDSSLDELMTPYDFFNELRWQGDCDINFCVITKDIEDQNIFDFIKNDYGIK